ncbi:MBL fold metallo-hydrolase [Thalassobacillus sp. CUG 92003]|uniref:MBL fold metallo-hydrolase n=1 Tax=Thalassobacillus sp. CUG 92003 TaxID=2736641 RepID=UPI0015E6A086|nr:MBL fold metallo-hydrolase [Thalassobacillus sp. CUG 92003]
MKIEFLGTGGAMRIPRPLCTCRKCREARQKGVPYSRSGPSLFIHGPDILIDTPEDTYMQLNRSEIERIAGVFYSHWHPDHVMGRRVLESLNADWVNHPPRPTQTEVYLPEQVGIDFNHWLGSGEHFQFFLDQGYINEHKLQDGDHVMFGDTRITPFRLAESFVYAFLLETDESRVLIAPDELNNWQPDESLRGVDLAILPMGIAEHHPLTGERQISEDHPLLEAEATFAETLDIIWMLQPKKAMLTHIEEPDGLSYDELKRVEASLQEQGWHIEFAYDTQVIDV